MRDHFELKLASLTPLELVDYDTLPEPMSVRFGLWQRITLAWPSILGVLVVAALMAATVVQKRDPEVNERTKAIPIVGPEMNWALLLTLWATGFGAAFGHVLQWTVAGLLVMLGRNFDLKQLKSLRELTSDFVLSRVGLLLSRFAPMGTKPYFRPSGSEMPASKSVQVEVRKR